MSEKPSSEGVPNWWAKGEWWDMCSCMLPCPCTFGEPGDGNKCEGLLPYRIHEGEFDGVRLDGLNVALVCSANVNWSKYDEDGAHHIWLIDERGTPEQREALRKIFMGEAGGWPYEWWSMMGECRGVDYTDVHIDIAKDLSYMEVYAAGGKVRGRAEAISGGMTPDGTRVQLINMPARDTGPSSRIATWAKVKENIVNHMGYKWDFGGRSAKHYAFEWTGPNYETKAVPMKAVEA